MNENTTKGYWSVFWGMIFVLPAYLLTDYIFDTYEGINALQLAFWGFFGSIIAVSPYFLKKKQKLSTEWKTNKKTLLQISFITSLGSILWFYTLQQGTSGMTAFLGKSDILFSFFLGIVFLKEKFSPSEFMFLGISLLGFILLSRLDGEITHWGVLAILGNSLLYSVQSFLVKKHVSDSHAPSFAFIRVIFLVFFLGIWGLLSQSLRPIPLEIFGIITAAQICGVFFFRLFYFEAHKYLPISQIGFLSLIQPILVFGASVLFLGESISHKKILGFCIITLGIILFLSEKFRLNRKQKYSTIPRK